MRTNLRQRLVEDRLVLAVVLALTAMLVVALVALGVAVNHGDDGSVAEAESAALKAARSSAVSMTTYDYRRLDADYSWVDDGATAGFAAQYRDANKPLRGIIEKLKATARGRVIDSAATAQDPDTVRVVMFIDQRITNKSNEQARSDKSRVVITMVRRDGRWLVDDVSLR